MSDSGPQPPTRFRRVPRSEASPADIEITRLNFLDSLDAIETFVGHAMEGGRAAFTRNSPAYASGSMAIIRTAALLETDEFRPFFVDLSDEVMRGIVTTRNIAAHAGYRSMNDDLLWDTLEHHLPPYLVAWRRASEAESSSE